MRVKSESEWQQQLADFAKDGTPQAEVFQEFVIGWAEAAEAMLDDGAATEFHDPVIFCLRNTLRATEAKIGRPPVGFVGMALIVLGTHWEPAGEPNDFFDSMTPIEQNLYADVAAAKLDDLNSQAEEAADAPN